MAQIDDIIAACQQARDVLNKTEDAGRSSDDALIQARAEYQKARQAVDDYIEAQLNPKG